MKKCKVKVNNIKTKVIECPDCGLQDVEVKVWANATQVFNEEILTSWATAGDNAWCRVCMKEIELCKGLYKPYHIKI